MTSVSGGHAVITGAGRGIGAAIAERLSSEVESLTLMGRNIGLLEDTAKRLGHKVDVLAISCDVTQPEAVIQAFQDARTRCGPVSILINNAGQAESMPFHKTSLDVWQRMLAVNLTGTFLCTQAVMADMLTARRGRIVNVASTAGLRGYGYVAAYVAAKHGVIGLTRSLALEVAKRGITVNAVCPGYTDTDIMRESIDRVVGMTGRSAAEATAEFVKSNPQGRLVKPEEVANTVAWLCSQGAGAITGQSISVSGGEVM
ncbi:MAG: SDR family NAD(P)-dependent oxidoreductase [Pseudomonadota bacterium]